MQAIMETLFDIVYLSTVITLGILMIRHAGSNTDCGIGVKNSTVPQCMQQRADAGCSAPDAEFKTIDKRFSWRCLQSQIYISPLEQINLWMCSMDGKTIQKN